MNPTLYRKYDVRRLNDPEGKHDDCAFFVLDPEHDPHARAALRAYADSCVDEKPDLAVELRVMAALSRVHEHDESVTPLHGEDLKPRCPTCDSGRTWRTWVAMDTADVDGWVCVKGHTWAEPTP